MKTNPWITWSQRVYRQLLRLYPQVYRAVYGMEMFRTFTSQCQEAFNQHGKVGIASLWTRTVVDLGITVVREHLADPQARMGLLEVNPHAPLPWKGVLVVLIPGLIFFVSQVAQLISINDWFFIVLYRAAYFLILPVLLVWLLTRRFPIWGLIPFGLLYRILGSYPPYYLLARIPFFRDIAEVDPFDPSPPWIDLYYFIPLTACGILLVALILYTARCRQIPPAAWKWMAFYGLLVVFYLGAQTYRFMSWDGLDWSTALRDTEMIFYFVRLPMTYLYESLPFLLLVFIGTYFARNYGGLSYLLLLGYLLPTIVFGWYGAWNDALPFTLVSSAVLVYRFVVALVAPVWLVRAASIPKRQRAAAIPVAVAIVTHLSLSMIAFLASAEAGNYQFNLLDFAMYIWPQLILSAGLGVAVALYLPGEETPAPPPVLAAAAE